MEDASGTGIFPVSQVSHDHIHMVDAAALEILLEAGADINAKDKWGNTLLHYIAASSIRGAKEAAALVTDFGTPDVNAVNNEGKMALDIAAEKNNETLVKFLLKYS